MKKVLTLLSTLLVSILLSGAALAQPSGGERHHAGHGFAPGHGPMGLGRLFHELDLSAAQRDQLHEIMDRHHSGPAAEVAKAFHEAQRQAEELALDPMADESRIVEAVRAAAAEAESLALEKHRLAVEIFGILTPEQQQMYREHLEEGTLHPRGRGRNN